MMKLVVMEHYDVKMEIFMRENFSGIKNTDKVCIIMLKVLS